MITSLKWLPTHIGAATHQQMSTCAACQSKFHDFDRPTSGLKREKTGADLFGNLASLIFRKLASVDI